MKKISELYKRYKGVDNFYILGAGPKLKEEIGKFPPGENGIVIVLNSAFMAFPEYDIHPIANEEFLELYKQDFTGRGVTIKPNHFPVLGYQEEFIYYPAWLQNEKEKIRKKNDNLICSYTILVPMLHFAMRCAPKNIYVYGIDMNALRHWDEKQHKTVTKRNFPGAKESCEHMQLLQSVFPEINVFCLNKEAYPVKNGTLRCI